MKYLICGKRSLRKNQIGKHKLLLYPKKKNDKNRIWCSYLV